MFDSNGFKKPAINRKFRNFASYCTVELVANLACFSLMTIAIIRLHKQRKFCYTRQPKAHNIAQNFEQTNQELP
jgi:hypothetical protein